MTIIIPGLSQRKPSQSIVRRVRVTGIQCTRDCEYWITLPLCTTSPRKFMMNMMPSSMTLPKPFPHWCMVPYAVRHPLTTPPGVSLLIAADLGLQEEYRRDAAIHLMPEMLLKVLKI